MTNFTWRILNCITTKDSQTPPMEVKTIFWQCVAETSDFTCVEYGQTQLAPADPINFIDYNKLTQEQLVGWVKKTMGNSKIQKIQKQLDSKLKSTNTELISPGLPWGNNRSSLLGINPNEYYQRNPSRTHRTSRGHGGPFL